MPAETPKRQYTPRDVAISVIAMVLASALLAGTTLIAKVLGSATGDNPLHPLQITAGRFVFAFLTLLPLLAWQRPSLKGAVWSNHLMRVMLGWAGVSCMFAASAVMRLSDATALS